MAYTEFYCTQTGNNLNAGSSLYANPDFDYTSGSWDGTATFTVGSGDPATDTNANTGATGVAVGAWASIYTSGTTASYIARVTSVTGTTIVLSTTAYGGTLPGSASGTVTCRVGGAWGGSSSGNLSQAFTFPTAAMTDSAGDTTRVNIQGGTTYAITAVMTRSAVGPVTFEGFTTSPGDGGGAVIDGGTTGASYNLLNVTGAGNIFAYLTFQHNGSTSSSQDGVTGNARNFFFRCCSNNVRASGFSCASSIYVECEAFAVNLSNSGTCAGFNMTTSSGHFIRCVAHDNTVSATTHGFIFGSTAAIHCIADRNGGYGFYVDGTAQFASIVGCDAYNNGVDGLNQASETNPLAYVENCNFVSNTTYGVASSAASMVLWLVNCGSYGNGTYLGPTATLLARQIGAVSYSASPYTSVGTGTRPTGGNFQVTSGSGGMAAGRGSFLQSSTDYSSTTTAHPDLGAGQASDTSSGGGGRQPKLVKMGG